MHIRDHKNFVHKPTPYNARDSFIQFYCSVFVKKDEGRDKYEKYEKNKHERRLKNSCVFICLLKYIYCMDFLLHTVSGRYKLQRNCNKPTVFIVMQALLAMM